MQHPKNFLKKLLTLVPPHLELWPKNFYYKFLCLHMKRQHPKKIIDTGVATFGSVTRIIFICYFFPSTPGIPVKIGCFKIDIRVPLEKVAEVIIHGMIN